VNHPTPAIVAQHAVQRLPRAALWLLAVAYVLPGFLGRSPWKSADMTGFGYMAELASGAAPWLQPTLMGLTPNVDALLPYWLGAWAIQLLSPTVDMQMAVRVPFAVLLGLSMSATWYATYYLARSPTAQPVAFAFGGEANAPDYARAMADGGLLAFIACLGLARLSHETTPATAQLCFTALCFYGVSALPHRLIAPALCTGIGLLGLALSGAPTVAVLLGAGSLLIHQLDRPAALHDGSGASSGTRDALPASFAPGSAARHAAWGWYLAALSAAVILLATLLGLWRWRVEFATGALGDLRGLSQLLIWFTWPAWPLALWTLWRWRFQLWRSKASRHMALPFWYVAVPMGVTLLTAAGDRALLLALPALAALAAFALPTLQRSVSALIDWFTLLFFTGWSVVIWVVWISMQTGVPHQPAQNVARLVPGFTHSFSVTLFFIAISSTLAWAMLVYWRVGRHRAALWKSLVLPAAGATLCWLLTMTLWLPPLDYARGYSKLSDNVVKAIAIDGRPGQCIETYGLDRGQIAAFKFLASLNLQPASKQASCAWLLVDQDAKKTLALAVDMSQWTARETLHRPTDKDDDVLLYKRASTPLR
jgi:hypothetical protein